MKKIIFTRPDGGVSVVGPFEGARLASAVRLPDGTEIISEPMPVARFLRRWPVEGAVAEWAETEEQFLARVMAKSVPADAANVQIVEEAAIPTDRTFRDAWKAGNGCVEHDMEQCREIHRNHLRRLRAPLLAACDVSYMRADEAGEVDLKHTIAAQKQALRDATSHAAIDQATTPEELKRAIPECLK